MSIFLITLLIGYTILPAVLVRRRGLEGRDSSALVVYLVLSAIWFLLRIQAGLHAVFPGDDWGRVSVYALVGLGVLYWEFTRAFLHRPHLSVPGWVAAGVAVVGLLALDTGLLSPPPFAFTIGRFPITEEAIFPVLSLMVPVIYTILALLFALNEYASRRSPMHRNRIAYWLLGTLALVLGSALAFGRRIELEFAGVGAHWVGSGLLTYVVLKAQAPNIATNVRRFLRYVLATLIPIVIAIGLSMGVVYLIGSSPPFQLRLTENTFAGMVIAGIIVFVLYQPLNTMTRRVLDRYWFGRAYETQEVVREYSQAVSKVISPEGVTAIAMGIIDKTLGIQRGTLLVIDEADDKGWRLRVLPGLGVPFGQPRLTLPDDTPLTAWLVDYRKPIHQYTLDVDPRFDAKNEKERQGWRQLNMEIFVPIHRSGALIGIMALGLRRSGRSYTSTELGLLATLADQTGVALENATLYDNVRRRAEQLTLLNEIGRAITTSLDLERTVGLIAARIQNAFRGATGFIFLWDESQGNLTLHSAFGPRKPKVGTFRVPLGQGVVGWVAQNGQPVLVPDFSIDSRYDRNIEGMLVPKAKSALCVPVMAKNNTIGVILVTDPSRINLSSAELGLLDSIGAFASIAIENARQVAAREAKLRRQVESLRIKIDELKRQKQVDEIVETEFFQDLRARAREMRRRHTRPRRRSRANPGEEKPDV